MYQKIIEASYRNKIIMQLLYKKLHVFSIMRDSTDEESDLLSRRQHASRGALSHDRGAVFMIGFVFSTTTSARRGRRRSHGNPFVDKTTHAIATVNVSLHNRVAAMIGKNLQLSKRLLLPKTSSI